MSVIAELQIRESRNTVNSKGIIMEKKFYASLAPSEMAIFRAASEIFAANVKIGSITEENEDEMIDKIVATTIKICDKVENSVRSDNELH